MLVAAGEEPRVSIWSQFLNEGETVVLAGEVLDFALP